MTNSLTPASILRALVHSLVLPPSEDGEADAFLIQLDPDAAALAVKPEQDLLILLVWESLTPPAGAEIEARITAALQSERPEVLAGSSVKGIHVAIIGMVGLEVWSGAAPPVYVPLSRMVRYYHVDPVESRCAGDGSLNEVLNRHLVRCSTTPLPVPDPAAALEAAERHGETTLGDEGLFTKAFGDKSFGTMWVLSIVLVVICLLESLFGGADFLPTLVRMGALNGDLVEQGQWWRVISAGWLHGGYLHLISNLYGLVLYAPYVEVTLGRARMLILLTLSILGGSLASTWGRPDQYSVGISGGLFGLMGALVAIALLRRHLISALSRGGVLGFVAVMLLLNVFGSLKPEVDMRAHLGGAATGVLLVVSGLITWRLPRLWAGEREARPIAWLYGLLAVLCLGLNVVSLALAAEHGRPWQLYGQPQLERFALPGTPLSIEVPAGTAARSSEYRDEEWIERVFGDGRYDPVMLYLSYRKLPVPIAEADRRAQLEALLPSYAAGDAAREVTLSEPPRIIEIDGQPTLFASQLRHGSVYFPRWVQFRGDYMIDLEASFIPDAPDKWKALEPAFIRSVR